MRRLSQRLLASTCTCNCRLSSGAWGVQSRSFSEPAATRLEQQQRKAERTAKLLEQFRQRARGSTPIPAAKPPPIPLPFSQPSQQPAVGSSERRQSFFKPPPPRTHAREAQRLQNDAQSKPQSRASREEQAEEDEDEEYEANADVGLNGEREGSAAMDGRRKAQQLRAQLGRSTTTQAPARNHTDIHSLAPSFADIYRQATATPAAPAVRHFGRHKSPRRVLSLSILGLPNSGKSSLTNRICHTHVTAVSPKSHTTRSNVTGVRTDVSRQVQLVVHDTPGVVGRGEARRHERDMAVAAWMAADDVNTVVVVVDAAKRWTDGTASMLAQLAALCRTHHALVPVLVLNKVDLVAAKRELLQLAQQCVEACRYIKDVYYVSVAEDDGVSDLIDALYARARPGEWEYEAGVASDMSPLERVEECVREKLYLRYNQELPYSIEQRHVAWSEGDGWVRVEQQLRVDSEAQRSIVIGGKGAGVEWVKREAEREASDMLGKKVSLHLSVQVGKKKDGVLGHS